jgi:membrane protease YdiL (CAAX protease family)
MMTSGDIALMLLALAVMAAWLGSGWMMVAVVRRLRAGLPIVAAEPQRPVPWRGIDVIAAVAIMILARIVAQVAINAIWRTAPGDASEITPQPDMTSQLVAGVLAMLGGAAVTAMMLLRNGASRADLGLWPLAPARDLRLAVGGLALVLAPLLAVAALLNRIVPYQHPIIDYLNQHSDPLAIAVVVVAAIVVAPIAEEFLFRRVLQGWLETLPLPLGPATAIGLASLAFAAAHAGHGLAWLPLLALGIVLGVLVRQTGSIVPAILLHALFNAVSVGLLLLQLSGLVPTN